MRFVLYFFLFWALGFPSTAYVESAEVVDRIVAVVNDDIITLFDLNISLKPYVEKIEELDYPPETERKMLFKTREDVLNQLIDQKITDQEIKRSKITVSEKEMDESIEQIKKTNLFTDEDLKIALSKEGLTFEEYRQRMKEQILRTKLINLQVKSKIVITREDEKNYYETHKDKYAGKEKYHLRNIIMIVSRFADENEKLKIKTKMETVLAKLKAGESFETMARTYSESSLASEGGDLGFFELDDLSPHLQKVIKGMKAGEFTPVIDTDQGYQIFLVQEILETPGKSLEDVSFEIKRILYNEVVNNKYQTWVKDLREQSHIKIIR